MYSCKIEIAATNGNFAESIEKQRKMVPKTAIWGKRQISWRHESTEQEMSVEEEEEEAKRVWRKMVPKQAILSKKTDILET